MTSCALVVSTSKASLPDALNQAIVRIASAAIADHGSFTVALSGGSAASMMSTLADAFEEHSIDPKFECWHVVLADERCVPVTDPDSNLGSLRSEFLSKTSIPESQVHGIDESKLASGSQAVAVEYEVQLKRVLEQSKGVLDLAILGFGPDGHTCSLFPDHPLLEVRDKLVASIDDSPKPPAERITLTFKVLNEMTRHIIFCGAGSSKSPILRKVFASTQQRESEDKHAHYSVTMTSPPPYPCAMVQPLETLTWIADRDAVEGVTTE